MPRKRADGEGTLTKRKDGRWEARYSPAAGGRRRSVYGQTQREVREKLRDLKEADRAGEWVATKGETLGKWAEHWLENIHRRNVRASSYGNDSSLIRKHIVPRLGHHVLAKLQPGHIEEFLTALEDDGVGPQTIRAAFIRVRQIIRAAVRARRIHSFPFEAIDPPRTPRVEAKALSQEDARKLIAAAAGTRDEALVVVAITTGARFGELAALTWGDVDLARGTITISKSVQTIYDPKREYGKRIRQEIGETKTASSRRTVEVGQHCVAALGRLRDADGTIPLPTARLFVYDNGEPIKVSTFGKRVWKPLLKAAGLPEGTQFKNATRHTAATLGLVQGVSPLVVAQRLGHASVSTTLSVYSHVTPALRTQAAETLETALFDGKADGKVDDEFDDKVDDNQGECG